MNSLLLSLALSSPQTALAHPPGFPPVATPTHARPYRPIAAPFPPPYPAPRGPSYYPPAPPFVPPFVQPPVAPPPHSGFPGSGHRGAMTLEQFARCFQPTCGTHHVCIIHPVTCQPVNVCFTLPHGCPKVCVNRRSIEFDYGRREVEINFLRNGRVDVDD